MAQTVKSTASAICGDICDYRAVIFHIGSLLRMYVFNSSVEDTAIGFYMSFLRLRRFHSPRFW